MAGSSREEGDVSSAEGDFVTVFAAEHEACVTGGEAEDFMGGGVVVMEIVDAVTPLGRPAVASEKLFEEGSRIGLGGVQDGAVEEDGEPFVVGHPAVAGEMEAFGFGVRHRGVSKGVPDGESERAPRRALKWRRSIRLIGVLLLQFSGRLA